MDSNLIQRVIELAVTAPSADNAQPWRFFKKNGRLHTNYHHNGNQDVFGSTGHATLLSTGALSFNLDLICGKSNTFSTIDTQGNWSISFSPPEKIDDDVEQFLRTRHTNRHPFRGPFAWPDQQLTEQTEPLKLQIITEPSVIERLSESVRLCSEIRFNNQELHEWLFSSLRWTPTQVALGDGLDLKTLHLPPGGSAFMKLLSPWKTMSALNSVGIYKLMAKLDSKPIQEAPALITISGPQNPETVWQSGRLLAQVWCMLNKHGFAVHPYYVLSDIANRFNSNKISKSWSKQASDALNIARETLNLEKNETPHILLRVGLPTIAPVRSKRRAVQTFIE
jgi:hypothetical protein